MPYYVKSHGPLVFKRGPYKTEAEAQKQLEAMKPLPMYGDVLLYVCVELNSPTRNVTAPGFVNRDPITRQTADSKLK